VSDLLIWMAARALAEKESRDVGAKGRKARAKRAVAGTGLAGDAGRQKRRMKWMQTGLSWPLAVTI